LERGLALTKKGKGNASSSPISAEFDIYGKKKGKVVATKLEEKKGEKNLFTSAVHTGKILASPLLFWGQGGGERKIPACPRFTKRGRGKGISYFEWW